MGEVREEDLEALFAAMAEVVADLPLEVRAECIES